MLFLESARTVFKQETIGYILRLVEIWELCLYFLALRRSLALFFLMSDDRRSPIRTPRISTCLSFPRCTVHKACIYVASARFALSGFFVVVAGFHVFAHVSARTEIIIIIIIAGMPLTGA